MATSLRERQGNGDRLVSGRWARTGHKETVDISAQFVDNPIEVQRAGSKIRLKLKFKMAAKYRIPVVLLGALVWIIVDQMTKALFKQTLQPGEIVSMLFGTVLVLATYNHGAFLSLGANMSDAARTAFFTYAVIAMLAGLLIWLIRSKKLSRAEVAAIASILGGGVGNLLDRVLNNGRVFDFLNIGIGGFRTGVFNIADIGITLGVILLLASSFIRKPERAAAVDNVGI